MFVDTKGTQKGLIFLYEMLRASIASLKTCSMMQKQLTQKSATKCLKNAEWILVLYSYMQIFWLSKRFQKIYPVQPQHFDELLA